jgi:3-phosphoshikimate 1-carboxyvinyltransferase
VSAAQRPQESPAALLGGTARFSGGRPLAGRAPVPGDKSISHRALIFAALAEGRSVLRGLSTGHDVAATAAALRSLGAEQAGDVRGELAVAGGRSRLSEADAPLDLGNSGTGMRLLTGVAASLPFLTVLVGDESLRRRPMERIVTPLREMGARVDGREGGRLAPLVVRGGGLAGVDYRPPVSSAQVKGAVLLAGIAADGETVVRETIATRRHTEELLELAGAPADVEETAGGYAVRVRRSSLAPFTLDVPGDPSQAAFAIVAGCVVPGSDVVVENVYLGPGRAGFLAVLERMGADVEVTWRSPTTGDVRARHGKLAATRVEGREVPDLIDEIPVLAVAAAFAEGTTVFADAAELRAKESDRIATMANELSRLGAEVEERPDGLVVHGGGPDGLGRPPAGAGAAVTAVASHGDHRVAMALAVAGLASGGGVVEVAGFDAVATSWPGFAATIDELTAGAAR